MNESLNFENSAGYGVGSSTHWKCNTTQILLKMKIFSAAEMCAARNTLQPSTRIFLRKEKMKDITYIIDCTLFAIRASLAPAMRVSSPVRQAATGKIQVSAFRADVVKL